jgi:hypothetical protein
VPVGLAAAQPAQQEARRVDGGGEVAFDRPRLAFELRGNELARRSRATQRTASYTPTTSTGPGSTSRRAIRCRLPRWIASSGAHPASLPSAGANS